MALRVTPRPYGETQQAAAVFGVLMVRLLWKRGAPDG